MVDFSNKHLTAIENFLSESINNNPILTVADLDPKEAVFQLAEEVRKKQFKWNEDMICVPNVVRILLLEEKADKTEDIEMLFSAPAFGGSLNAFLEDNHLHLLMPLRVEVELMSKGSSSMMYCAGRCVATLDWPLPEEAEIIDVVIDDVKKRVLEVLERKPRIQTVARLNALNADVYRNNFFITTEVTYIGRLRVVRDADTGRFLRRNDFVFAQLEDPKAVGNSVSRQHAKIEFRGDRFFLIDQGSANSTAVERLKADSAETMSVAGGTGLELQDGDTILLGTARVRFNIMESFDLASLAYQLEQDRMAQKLERGTAKETVKVPIFSELLKNRSQTKG